METTEPMIQDVNSLKPMSPPPQAETAPIMTDTFHQDNQGESSSNFETVVLSQLSLIVQLTQSMNKRLTKVERDVDTIKRLMALDDDDDMVVDDIPPNSPKVPRGTDSDIDSDNDQLNHRKIKASFLGGAHDAEVGSSFVATASDPSISPPKKKKQP
ncbi:unnamed protein product [Lactuca saligna]|uniref:Uncharacterized protein n=1 Tax=Lactuca saligna TaxID=75948 RepID=A0AA35YSI5_LACSI|nr:unnamed protein product [Lactuca saligna]